MNRIIVFRKKINYYLLFVILIIFGIYQYGISKICGFTLVPDEFGYWASAARGVGYNWSDVASLGSYYSFGYSLILMPILWLFRDGVMAYRAAVTVNMLLMCVSEFLILGIIKRMFPETDQVRQVFAGGIAVFYPVWIFNMQMTMTEALLMFLFVLITYLFVHLVQEVKVVTAVLLAVSLVYIYCVHMRAVGILIACVITLILWTALERPKLKTVLTFWGILLVSAVLAVVLKQNTIAEVFANADSQLLAGNDYGGQWGKFRQIFSFYGMRLFIKEIIAKVFYLGLASFGIFYWGLAWTVKRTFSLMRKYLKREKNEVKREKAKREKTESAEWAALFLLLSAIGEILISSIYMHSPDLIDALIYGRYDEFVLPVFLVFGMIAMSRSRWLFRGTLAVGTCTGLMIPMILEAIEAGKMKGLRGYMVAGISYLLPENDLNVYRFFRDTWLLGFGVMLLTAFLVWLSRKYRNGAWILAGIIVLEIAAGLQISHRYTYRVNNSNFADRRITEEILDRAGAGDRIAYLDEGKPPYIDFLQMQLGEKPVEIISENELELGVAGELFLIAHIDTAYKEELEELFDQRVRANTFYLYYNKERTR